MSFPANIPILNAVGAPVTFPLSAAAATPLNANSFACPANGKVVVSIGIVRSSPAAVAQIVQNGAALDLNIALGGTLTSGAKYDFATGVQVGDTVNVQMTTATTLAVLELNFVKDQ